MDFYIDMVVFVLIYMSPMNPADLPTFVSTWNTRAVCEQKAKILNDYFKNERFSCIQSNVRESLE